MRSACAVADGIRERMHRGLPSVCGRDDLYARHKRGGAGKNVSLILQVNVATCIFVGG